MKKPIVLGIIVLIVVLLPVGYFVNKRISQKAGEKMAEELIEAQTGGQVDIDSDSDGGNITIKTEDGQAQYSAGGEAKLPDGFPQELVIVNDAKLILSSSSDAGSSLTYLTDFDQDAVFNKYLANLPSLGWEKDMEVKSDQGMMINFSKGSESVVVTIGENTSEDASFKTTVSLVWIQN